DLGGALPGRTPRPVPAVAVPRARGASSNRIVDSADVNAEAVGLHAEQLRRVEAVDTAGSSDATPAHGADARVLRWQHPALAPALQVVGSFLQRVALQHGQPGQIWRRLPTGDLVCVRRVDALDVRG